MDFISIYILHDNNMFLDKIMRLNILLSGDKKRRFIDAVQTETKRKIICSTLLSYYALRHHGIKKEIAKEVFNTSDYLLSISEVFHSNSHSKNVYIQVISKKSIAVDIEKYIERSSNIYGLLQTETMLEFYSRWLEKECTIKIGNLTEKNFRVFFYKNYIYGIMSENQNVKRKIVTIEDIFKQLKQDKLYF